jgi:hypothetical protein
MILDGRGDFDADCIPRLIAGHLPAIGFDE